MGAHELALAEETPRERVQALAIQGLEKKVHAAAADAESARRDNQALRDRLNDALATRPLEVYRLRELLEAATDGLASAGQGELAEKLRAAAKAARPENVRGVWRR